MNPHLRMTLDEAVGEVLNYLTGLDLHYIAELDRYRSITRTLNRALRLVSTEHEWSFYSALEDLGHLSAGQQSARLRSSRRPRILLDDSVRIVDEDGCIREWAYFLPRESLHKYRHRTGLWVASVGSDILFSRPIAQEDGLKAYVPVMRDPRQLLIPSALESIEELISPPPAIPAGAELIQLRNFHNPEIIEEWVSAPGLPPYEYTDPENSLAQLELTPEQIRNQSIDFDFPDLIVLKAAFLYAQTDPIMQPRVQTLEGQYKDLFYALTERDTNHTDEPYRNDWRLPIQSSLRGDWFPHQHPHSDERTYYNYK